MKKTMKLTLCLLFAIGMSACKHLERKAPCDFENYKSDNQSQKEDKTR